MQSQKVLCWWQTDSFIYDFLKRLDFPWEWICFLFLVVFTDCPFCSVSIFLLLLFLNFLWNLCFFEVHLKVKVHKQKQLTMQLIICVFLSVVETIVGLLLCWGVCIVQCHLVIAPICNTKKLPIIHLLFIQLQLGHPHKMFRFSSPDWPIFLEK